MPKEISRLFLLVKNIQRERLQEVTEEEAVNEGFLPEPICESNCHGNCLNCDSYPYNSLGAGKGTITNDYNCCFLAMDKFADIWNEFNIKKEHSYESNPWI